MDITPPTIEELAVVLQNSGVALLPTDTVWSAVVLLDSRRGFGKLEHCLAMVPGLPWPELLVRDTEQAKQYIAHLHPRLETLWNHHTRPLSILFDNPVNLPPGLLQADGGVVLRLVTDVFLKRLIEKLGLPLIALPAFTAQGEVALHFDEISGALKEQMDYIAGNQGRGIAPGEISVMVRLTAIEELEFIRE
ncbi:MAG: Sua5/YciO/YrdC/YwlC family protein [Saprospiraceae bacterium]